MREALIEMVPAATAESAEWAGPSDDDLAWYYSTTVDEPWGWTPAL